MSDFLSLVTACHMICSQQPPYACKKPLLGHPDTHDLNSAGIVRDGWNGFNMLHESASTVAALDIGFVPFPQDYPEAKFVYNLGADDYDAEEIPESAFVVYQGHHGERGALRADVILPGAAYTEKAGTFVNFEGRPQQTRAAISAPADAREDWKIVRAVSEVAGPMLPYDSLDDVHERMASVSPTFKTSLLNKAQQGCTWLNGEYSKTLKGTIAGDALHTSVKEHFMTDVVSRASQTMARVVKARAEAGT